MIYCRICGDEYETRFYPGRRQILCRSCAADTPAKIGREAFDRAYWRGDDPSAVPESTRADFYEDYLRSRHTLAEYIHATTED